MFTLAQARSAVGDAAAFARGRAYVQDGRVQQMEAREQEGILAYKGTVRGNGHYYGVSFCYDNRKEAFLSCACSCPAFAGAGFGCKHVAALMIAACAGKPLLPEKPAMNEDSPRRSAAKSLVSGLLEDLRPVRGGTRSVHLYPIVTPHRAGAALELRIGSGRAYAVRNLWEFAARVKAREAAVYGRELTFSHRAQDVVQEDEALLWHIVSLTETAQRLSAGRILLSGTQLDRTMELLAGREADVRREDGTLARVPVEEGESAITVSLRRENGGVLLLAQAEHAALGLSGAYIFEPERIVCVTGSAFERLAPLLRAAQDYPDGVLMDGEETGVVCARLLAPAQAYLRLSEGQDILAAHMPDALFPRFYIDLPDKLTCRILFGYRDVWLGVGEDAPDVRRDTLAEEAALAAAKEIFPVETAPGEYAFEGSDEEMFELMRRKLAQLEDYGEVLVAKRLEQRFVSRPRTMNFGMSVQGDKLLVTGDLGGFTQDDLRQALAACRERLSFVRLDSGVFLSGEALEQAGDTAQMLDALDLTAEQVQQGAQTPASRAMYIEQALKGREHVQLRAPKAMQDWLDRLARAQSTRTEQPQGLRCTLRSYQLEGLSWMRALCEADFGGILADDMGLGKTVQALALLQSARERGEEVRALVVCPASLQLNWLAEAKRFVPEMTCTALLGSAAQRREIAGQPVNLLITSYDQLRRDVQEYEGMEFTHMLLDEAQNIKNAAAQATKAAKAIRARHRFAMTGTPVENRLSELWSIFDFLMPGYLHSYKKFRDRFESPIVRDGNERARESLRAMVAPFILRRMKKDVLSDLPEKVETVMESEMTTPQRRQYAAAAAKLVLQADGGLADAKDRMRLLAGLTRLRQICCDPRLCLEGYTGGSGKLDQCVELVCQSIEGGHRVLLFSQFTSMLELLYQALEDKGFSLFMLTGDTDKEERMRMADAFNAGEADVFLISLKAGGTGLNLTGADVVVHYDPWWNTAAQNQATDRAYRIGQTRGVQVIRLIAADSIEERILHLQEAKSALSDGVLTGEDTLFTIDPQQLKALIRG